MTTYIVTINYTVEADSESAARQCYIDGDLWNPTLANIEPVHAEDCDLDEDCSCGPRVERDASVRAPSEWGFPR